ncbi:hypothetical protein, partial [Acinetobacter sp.]|uniref:hypothetical protein n=1 Tax=Acinetobacter sp. TaxID=472 RepID=UPI0035B434A4
KFGSIRGLCISNLCATKPFIVDDFLRDHIFIIKKPACSRALMLSNKVVQIFTMVTAFKWGFLPKTM